MNAVQRYAWTPEGMSPVDSTNTESFVNATEYEAGLSRASAVQRALAGERKLRQQQSARLSSFTAEAQELQDGLRTKLKALENLNAMMLLAIEQHREQLTTLGLPMGDLLATLTTHDQRHNLEGNDQP